MKFNTIIVQLDVDSAATPRLMFAQDLANRFAADLIAFAAADAHVFVPSDEGGGVAAEMMRQRAEEIEERLNARREEFLSVTGDSARVSWRGELGDPTHLLAINGRAADLIVTCTPASGVASDHHRTVDAGTLILSAGRPVLFAADSLAPLRTSASITESVVCVGAESE